MWATLHVVLHTSRSSSEKPRATVLHLRGKLSSWDNYIRTISYDIVKFNEYVKDLMDSLTIGETTHDLLANCFKAYKSVKDCDFTTYIKKKEDEYEEGQDVNINMLMLQASNKYKTMFQNQTWNAPSPEEEKILALESQIQKLKKQKKKSTQDKREARMTRKERRKEKDVPRKLSG